MLPALPCPALPCRAGVKSVRLLRALPEVMVIIKAMAVASRAVACTMVLLISVTYVSTLTQSQKAQIGQRPKEPKRCSRADPLAIATPYARDMVGGLGVQAYLDKVTWPLDVQRPYLQSNLILLLDMPLQI